MYVSVFVLHTSESVLIAVVGGTIGKFHVVLEAMLLLSLVMLKICSGNFDFDVDVDVEKLLVVGLFGDVGHC